METTCQASYPLNSENASPFGTFRAYLSCADIAQPPTPASTPVISAIVSILLLLIISPSLIEFRAPNFHSRLRPYDQFAGRQYHLLRSARPAGLRWSKDRSSRLSPFSPTSWVTQ